MYLGGCSAIILLDKLEFESESEKMDIKLNNGKEVLRSVKETSFSNEESFLRMIESANSSDNAVNITDNNIRSNARFILDIWD